MGLPPAAQASGTARPGEPRCPPAAVRCSRTAPRCSRSRPCWSPPCWPACSPWFPWFSPLASGLPGVLLLAWTALYLVSVRRAVEFIPLRSHSFGAGWESLLFNGILGAAGAVMVFPLFIPSRWRAAGPGGTGRVRRRRGRLPGRRAVVRPDGHPGGAASARRHRRGRPAARWRRCPAVGGGVRPVDTTRITGASRALRNTGSFRVATALPARSRVPPAPSAAPSDTQPARQAVLPSARTEP